MAYRKPVAAVVITKTEGGYAAARVFCDDGAVFKLSNGNWEQETSLPGSAAAAGQKPGA